MLPDAVLGDRAFEVAAFVVEFAAGHIVTAVAVEERALQGDVLVEEEGGGCRV